MRPQENKIAAIVEFLYETSNPKLIPVTFAQFAGTAQALPEHMADYAPHYRRPGDTPFIEIAGLKVIYDPVEVFRLTKDMMEKKGVYAPAGWITRGALARELMVYFETLGKPLTPHLNTHPEWEKEYLDATGKPNMHLAPELCDLMREWNKTRRM